MSGDVVLLPQILLISYNVTKSQRMILVQSFPLLVLDMRCLLLRSTANFGIAVSLQFHCPFFFFLFLHIDLAANFGDRFRAEPLPGKGRERGCFPISSKWMKKEMENLLLRNVNRSAPNLRKFETSEGPLTARGVAGLDSGNRLTNGQAGQASGQTDSASSCIITGFFFV